MSGGRRQTPALGDVTKAVAKSQRPKARDPWLAIGGWRINGTMPGEALVSALQENA